MRLVAVLCPPWSILFWPLPFWLHKISRKGRVFQVLWVRGFDVYCGSAVWLSGFMTTNKQTNKQTIRSGFCGLPYYCAPLVCIPDVIRGLAVWRHYKPKTKDSKHWHAGVPFDSVRRFWASLLHHTKIPGLRPAKRSRTAYGGTGTTVNIKIGIIFVKFKKVVTRTIVCTKVEYSSRMHRIEALFQI